MATFNDGGAPVGCRTVKFYSPGAVDGNGSTTWTAAKGIYILENLSINRPQYTQKRYNEARVPNASIGVDDFVEGTAVVQIQYAATARIANGDAFNTVLSDSPGGTAEGFKVTGCDTPEAQGDIKKQSVRLEKIVAATPPTAFP